MKAVIQKVNRATLYSEGNLYSQISGGIVVLLGVSVTDTPKVAQKMAEKLLKLRIFADANEKINLDIFQTNGEILLVSNFTLYGNLKGTNRPDFVSSAPPEKAEPLYMQVYNILKEKVSTKTGVFRTHMNIEMLADGPNTYVLEINE